VNDAPLVRPDQSVACLQDDANSLLHRERTARDPILQRFAVIAGHREEDFAFRCFIDFVDGADVGVIQRRGGAGFVKEATLGFVVPNRLRRQELQRHRPAQLQILGPVHHAHAATAEFVLDPVMGYGAADHSGSPGDSSSGSRLVLAKAHAGSIRHGADWKT